MVVMTPALKEPGHVKPGNGKVTPSSMGKEIYISKLKIPPMRINIGEMMTLCTGISAIQFLSTLISSLSSSHAVSISLYMQKVYAETQDTL